MPNITKILLILGGLLIVGGLLYWGLGDKLSWFGHLPGDIRIKRDNFSFYMPITSMILLSVAVSVILWIIRRFFS